MGADTITVTEEQLVEARRVVTMTAESLGVDMEHAGTQEFLEVVAMNKATSRAWDLFNTAIIHKVTSQGHWAPGGCKHVHVDEGE